MSHVSVLVSSIPPPESTSHAALAGRPALWEPLARELTRRIVSGTYGEGALVPTEAQLGGEFLVSRTVVREGVKVLAEKGVLAVHRGRGTVVRPRSDWRPLDPDLLAARLEHGDRERVLRDVLALRKAIEPELAAGAARDADDRERAQLVARMDDLAHRRDDPSGYVDADDAFHRCIADIARQPLLAEVLKLLALPVSVQRRLTSRIPGGSPAASHRQHEAVFRAIVERDAASARTAMREHLEWAEDRLDSVLGGASVLKAAL